jgi:hypothetical protein
VAAANRAFPPVPHAVGPLMISRANNLNRSVRAAEYWFLDLDENHWKYIFPEAKRSRQPWKREFMDFLIARQVIINRIET